MLERVVSTYRTFAISFCLAASVVPASLLSSCASLAARSSALAPPPPLLPPPLALAVAVAVPRPPRDSFHSRNSSAHADLTAASGCFSDSRRTKLAKPLSVSREMSTATLP